jgi:hypothetical protein
MFYKRHFCCLSSAPSAHIERLYAKWESALSEEKRLMDQIAQLEGHHQETLKLRLDALQKEMNDKMADAVEKTRLEGNRYMALILKFDGSYSLNFGGFFMCT